MLTPTFNINEKYLIGYSGPSQFMKRLDTTLNHYLIHNSQNPYMDIACIEGSPNQNASHNILRLDGLYFDLKANNKDRNKSIFKAYKEFDHIVFQSKFSRDMYFAFVGERDKTSIIYNGAPIKNYNSSIASAQQIFLDEPLTPKLEQTRYGCRTYVCASSWRRHKRLEEIVDAFCTKHLEDSCLIVFGNNIPQEVRDKISHSPNIDVYGEYHGFQEIDHYYLMADAFIHLSWLDWCPNAVVEAISCGLPIICSHNGGTHELLERFNHPGKVLKLEDDYIIGTEVDLYNPPEIDIDYLAQEIANANLEFADTNSDIKMLRVAKEYLKVCTDEDGYTFDWPNA